MIDTDIYAKALEQALRERNTLNESLAAVQAECTRMKGELEQARNATERPVQAGTTEQPKENGIAARITPDKLDRIADLMRGELQRRFPGIKGVTHEPWDVPPPSVADVARHLLFVCEGIEVYARHVRRKEGCCTAADGARLVEFVHGALFALGWATLKDITEWSEQG